MSSIPQEKTSLKSSEKSSAQYTPGIDVALSPHGYRIDVTSNDTVPLCLFLKDHCQDRRPLVVTNATVAPLIIPDLKRSFNLYGLKMAYLILPDGERFKNLDTVNQCYEWLIQQGADRHSVLLALGGGVIGDIAGFVAATYMRGLHYVQVPTTLLAQIDSSIGGKVGVDHKEGKNLIGSFFQPVHVHIDVSYLESLPEREYLCGLAEVIKYAVIQDEKFFAFLKKERIGILRRESAPLERIVQTCCQIKAAIVMADEKETSGKRIQLNLGHTFGHAIERLTEYRQYRHGEAVAMGMVAAANISQKLGYCSPETRKEIVDIIASYELPIEPPKFSRREWEVSLKRDKKMKGDDLEFVFVERVGSVRPTLFPPKEVVKLLLKEDE